jgi:hypothetical protein
MTWTTPAALREQVRKLWDSGRMLAGLAGGEAIFPRRLRLRKPTSSELAERFDEVRGWIRELAEQANHYRLEWQDIRHRTLGGNRVPAEVWVDSLDDGLDLIGKTREARCFVSLVEITGKRQPQLVSWLRKRPLNALALEDDWSRLLDVVAWLQTHPRPMIYLRQVDIHGVDSKFIESHRKVLAELFDLVMDEKYIDETARGATGFCRRYGFSDKPLRIRFRLLDSALNLLDTSAGQDICVTSDTFAELNLRPKKVYITENEINFLAFPELEGGLVVFGAGYGFQSLAQAGWLHRCRLWYWGDIDTHGFAILDRLRIHFPAVESFLMDRDTLLAHRLHWGMEPQQTAVELPRLSEKERNLYDDLRYNRLAEKLRLEQERISYKLVKDALCL